MKIFNVKSIAYILATAVLFVPFATFAQQSGVLGIPCGDLSIPGGHMCGFNDLIILINKIVHFLIYYIVVPLIALAFVVVGANFILNPNKEGAKTAAKQQFEMIAYGIFWILAGFLLVKTVLFAFLSTEQITWMKFILDVTQ